MSDTRDDAALRASFDAQISILRLQRVAKAIADKMAERPEGQGQDAQDARDNVNRWIDEAMRMNDA